MHKAMVQPTETDKFMTKKGKSVSFKHAKRKHEFWLFLFSFSILVGISRMVDDNATIIALHN
jgi:hypothetical protein